MNPSFSGWTKAALLIPLFVVGAVLLVGLVVMTLWNGIMPDIFGLGVLTIWQAIGLLVLGKILFGGSRKHKKHHYA